jgi:hypothetical protein
MPSLAELCGARLDGKDPRSRAFGAVAAPVEIRSVNWSHLGPILRQWIGSCTGHSAIQALNCRPNHARRSPLLGDAEAMEAYHVGTTIDPFPGEYPPTDTGSSVTAVAKALRQIGRIKEFRWGFGFDDALAMLMDGPVIVGTTWKRSMMQPDENGYLKVSGSDDDLGHAYVWTNYSKRFRRIKILNSWGLDWGRMGFAYLHEEDARWSIDDKGEAVKYIR